MYNMQVTIPEGDGESGVATLTIQRAKGTAGEVAIYWEVSQDGQLDLVRYNGTVIFPDVSQPPPNGTKVGSCNIYVPNTA